MRRVDRLVSDGGIVATLFNQVCSSAKALLSPANLADVTFSEEAVAQLMANERIFSDIGVGGRRSRKVSRIDDKPVPQPCAITARTVGTATLGEYRRDESLAAKQRQHAGNWVVMRRPGVSDPDRAYVTVCGFYDCKSRSPDARIERLVKHMNLCRYATERDDSLRYLASGTFVLGTDGPEDRMPALLVNARSGSWAMAKVLLQSSGTLSEADLARLDGQVSRFVRSRVKKLVTEAVLRPAGRPRKNLS